MRVVLVCISGSTLSIESTRDPVPCILFCHFLKRCPFSLSQSFIATTASLKPAEMETEKSVRARKPELLTPHYLKHSQLAVSSYKEGWKFASECASHSPCLQSTKVNERRMWSGHCLSHIERTPEG